MEPDCSSTILPRFVLEWSNLTVQNKSSKFKVPSCWKTKETLDEKFLLDNVCGRLESGQSTALIGPSGSGKTSLLTALTARLPANLTSDGVVTLNGRRDKELLRKNVVFVEQFEWFPPQVTPREYLVFNALLRLPKKVSYENKLGQVENAIISLGLSKCADSKIGGIGCEVGISGGERQKLAFATEALLSPALLFCDELTSGLDSFAAMEVVKIIKSLSNSGCGILCSIHQPSSSAFAIFDKIILLAGGRVAFHGTVEKALDFFSNLNYHCPENYCPADFFISIVESRKIGNLKQVQKICDNFLVTSAKEIKETTVQNTTECTPGDIELKGFEASWSTQTLLLMRRNLSCWKYPNTMIILSRFIFLISIIIFSMTIRVHSSMSLRSVRDITGFLAFIANAGPSYYSFGAMHEFLKTLPLFLKERNKTIYCTSAFLTNQLIFQLIDNVIHAFYITIPVYWIIGMNTSFSGFIFFTLTMFCEIFLAIELENLINAIFNFSEALIIFWRTFNILFNVFNHFQHSFSNIPACVSWLSYISWQKYGMESMSIILWERFNGHFECDKFELSSSLSCIQNGEDVLQYLHIDPHTLYFNMGYMFVIGVFCRLLFGCCLYIKTRS